MNAQILFKPKEPDVDELFKSKVQNQSKKPKMKLEIEIDHDERSSQYNDRYGKIIKTGEKGFKKNEKNIIKLFSNG